MSETTAPSLNNQRDAEQSEALTSRGAGPAIAVILVLFVLLSPLLYFLSVGPIVWFTSRQIMQVSEDSVLGRFYAPLLYAADNNRAIGACFEWYAEFWRADQPMPAIPLSPPAPAPARSYPTS